MNWLTFGAVFTGNLVMLVVALAVGMWLSERIRDKKIEARIQRRLDKVEFP